jgi:transcriptional regulator with XRE-family HTH domain
MKSKYIDHLGIQTLARNVAELRTAAGLSQAQLATKAGLPNITIQKLEQGRLDPTYSVVCKLADALGVRLGALGEGALPAKKEK